MHPLMIGLDQLRECRQATLQALAWIADDQIERPIPWQGNTTDVRYLLLELAVQDDRLRVLLGELLAGTGDAPSEAARILGLAAEVRGQIKALLVGLPVDLVNRAPGPGQWTVRQIIGHIEQVDQRYMLHTAYAVERMHSLVELPLRIPDDRLPPVAPAASSDQDLPAILARMDSLRDEIAERLADVSSQDMTAPTLWTGWPVDTRFRLHRFAGHDRQHLVQVARTLQDLGFLQTEAQLILGQAEIARGKLESMLIGLPDEMLPRVREALEGLVRCETEIVQTIQQAIK